MFDLLQGGGPLVWVILAMGLVALAVFLERALVLHQVRIKSEDFV